MLGMQAGWLKSRGPVHAYFFALQVQSASPYIAGCCGNTAAVSCMGSFQTGMQQDLGGYKAGQAEGQMLALRQCICHMHPSVADIESCQTILHAA